MKLNGTMFIDGYLQLRELNIDNYNWDGEIEWNKDVEEEFNQGKLEPQEDIFSNPKSLTKEERDLARLIKLIADAQIALENGNFEELANLLAQIKQYSYLPEYPKLINLINKLEQALLASQTARSEISAKLIIVIIGSSIRISLLTIGLLFWMTNWVKNFFHFHLLKFLSFFLFQ